MARVAQKNDGFCDEAGRRDSFSCTAEKCLPQLSATSSFTVDSATGCAHVPDNTGCGDGAR
jgi:hypothetical protein